MTQIMKQTLDLQEKINELGNVGTELKSSLSFMNESVESVQKEMKDKVDAQVFADSSEDMVKKIDDLENRSKRNNLVFWNVPEGEEKDIGCINLLQAIVVTHMKITGDEDILIERVHRSGHAKSNYNSTTEIFE